MDLLSRMRTFTRIVELGSLSRAASSLRLSVPAVSRQLTSLESELGVSLVVRSTRRLSVTESGRAYYERAARVLLELDDMDAVFRGTGEVRGTVVVSAPVTLGLARIAPVLTSVVSGHPALRVDLRLDDRAADLVGEGVDVAIRAGMAPPDSTQLIARPIMRWRRVLVASPAYLRRSGAPRTTAELEAHATLVHLSARGRSHVWQLDDGGEAVSVTVDGQLRTNALAAILESCKAGLGIALLPEWLVRDDVTRRKLKRVLPHVTSPEVVVNVLFRQEHRTTARIRAVVDGLTTELSKRY